jgi:hypothetical protein
VSGAAAERALAAAALAAVGLASWAHRRAGFRAEAPLTLAVLADGPSALVRYDPARRELRGVILPDGDEGRALAAAAALRGGTPKVLRLAGSLAASPEALADSAAAWKGGPATLLRAWRRLRRSDLDGWALGLLAFEALSLPPGERPFALFPVEKSGPDPERTAILAYHFWLRRPPEPDGRLTVEVLNATARPGLAMQVTRALRHAGVDVVEMGNQEGEGRRSLLRDRRGDRTAALRVRDELGLDLPVVTELVPWPRAHATLVMGDDFPIMGGEDGEEPEEGD